MTTFLKSAFQQLNSFTAIELFYIAIAVFTSIILGLISAMVFIMLAKSKQASRQKHLQAQFKQWLVSIILHEPEDKKTDFEIPATIALLLQKRFARRALLSELIRLKDNLSGQSGDNIQQLFNQLHLGNLSAHDMRSSKWYLKAKGIQELAAMEQKAYLPEIYTLTQHRHPVVRMEAQTALVYLQGYAGLTFFRQLAYPLTEYHQAKLLQLLANQPIPSPEMVRSWLVSPNPTVVQFTLKLISEQHATQFQEDVITCLSHPSELVRSQAISCLGEIPSAPAALALRTHYTSENSKALQLNILSGLLKTGTTNDLPFLHQLRQTPDEGMRLAVEKAIRHLQQQA
ncbi:HEAT repeat domain-containing protein [Pontibacter fetidus]|uniref:HEAT repeat domain-containing protein n=1 Tax=Pontibacter fetidus TaxID=2700082 RepID=A0A6B2H4Y3_9BACT|nr:HEAT repeat domain-containing protein [Pontibacter fetidus]NDK55387.1 HEAT repeat domain-containing protein [Pontibacter fetidus]